MSAIHVDGLSFSYTSAVSLFEDISFHLGPGWYGLVGPNGGGKTTLLRLMMGSLQPDKGTVAIDPRDAVISFTPQTMDRPDREVFRLAESWQAEDFALRGRLGLEPTQLDDWELLSPGERKRWQIGAALSMWPDLMLVDEPTNHLDGEARDLLVTEMARFGGVGVVVSHDRDLLDALTTNTIRVGADGATLHGGSYQVAAEEWRREEEALLDRAAELRRQERKLAARVDRRRREIEETSAAQRRKRRAGDSDARSMGVKMHGAFVEKVKGRELKTDQRRLERVGDVRAELGIRRSRGGPIAIDHTSTRRPLLASYEGLLQIDGRPLVDVGAVEVRADSRIRVAGPNGSGKTTLLKAIRASTPLSNEEILWLPQELSDEDRERIVSEITDLSPDERGGIMALASRLGIDPSRLLESDLPSPGEARKLVLAHGLGSGVALAILDEPTNHLDLPSIERLEEAIDNFNGALLLVSHDPQFVEGLVSETWEISGERLIQ
ncbi:MAG: ATP-binding cassette domain-containing protein [Acidimicrobiia bacterium]|nr:ATP-binding cassette domain-containing protein [Acidimicrobiia bacterium]